MDSGPEYVAAGYYVSNRAASRQCSAHDSLPARISASNCFSAFLPDAWAISWCSVPGEERLSTAALFGVSAGGLSEILRWTDESFSRDFGWPSTFYTLDGAKEARVRFVPPGIGVTIFGLALHHTLVPAFIDAARPNPPKPGYAPEGESGLYECVKAGKALEPGGESIGFEILACVFGITTCSWRCNGVEQDCADELGIVANSDGLVGSFEEALRCSRLIQEQGRGAEPGMWYPWLVTEYH